MSKQTPEEGAGNDQDRTVLNGIDVDQLLTTIDSIKDDPNVASFTFRASSRWRNQGMARGLHPGSVGTPRYVIAEQCPDISVESAIHPTHANSDT